MTPLPRIRRHTDGRVALCFEPESGQDHWRIFEERPRYCFSGSVIGSLSDGWSEIFVAELPEPDHGGGWALPAGDGVLTATADGIALDGLPWPGGIEELRSESLAMLAAVAACERYRAEREATT